MIGRMTLAALLCAAPLLAQRTAEAQQPTADGTNTAAKPTEFRKLRVEGSAVHDAVRSVLSSIRWRSGLSGALRASADTGKPVLWIQALGELRGYT